MKIASLAELNDLAIKPLLLQQLQAAIVLSAQNFGLGTEDFATRDRIHKSIFNLAVPAINNIKPEVIPLHQVQDEMVYKSALALKLASICLSPALDIAHQLVASLRLNQDTIAQPLLDFTVQVFPPGWIYFYLTDKGIAEWLQNLTQIPPMLGRQEEETSQSPINLFPVQYAHARCCSLLRLGHQEGLIKLSPDTKVVAPNPIPWLNADNQLCLVHPAEKRLISQLLGVLDELSQPSKSDLYSIVVKLAASLSDAMLSFHSSCRIWGEVKTQTPQLAQARLGLVGVTQSVLRLMLQDILDANAPVEL